MNELFFLGIAISIYFLASLAGATSIFFGGSGDNRFAKSIPWLMAFGLTAQALYFTARWHNFGQIPMSNMFESLVLTSAAVVAMYLVWLRTYKLTWVTVLAPMLAFVVLGGALLFDTSIMPLMPALQSKWLSFHVITCMVSYSAFFFAAALSLVYLKNGNSNLPDCGYSITVFGFLLLTLGITTGAVWANQAWGTWWSWDPKETWSLVTWIVYVLYLHVPYILSALFAKTHQKGALAERLLKNKNTVMAVLNIVGFIAVLVTYFGVTYLATGLHSY